MCLSGGGREGGRGERGKLSGELEEACNEDMGATEREAAAYMWIAEGRRLYEWWRYPRVYSQEKYAG